MNPLIVIGVAGLGLGLALAASDSGTPLTAYQRVTGLPRGRGIDWRLEQSGLVTPLWHGASIHGQPIEAKRAFAAELSARFAQRRTALPAGASEKTTDKYTKELYGLASWMVWGLPGDPSTHEKIVVTANLIPYDEFGRVKPGDYGSGGGFVESTLAPFTKNPLGRAVVTIAVVYFTGPAGVAAMGAYAAWESRGSEFSVKSVALAAARTYVVSQCGEACGMAFDFGVGVASGESVDEAAEDALLAQMSDEQRAYYEQGKAAYKDVVNA
jgi:hypothetical protein